MTYQVKYKIKYDYCSILPDITLRWRKKTTKFWKGFWERKKIAVDHYARSVHMSDQERCAYRCDYSHRVLWFGAVLREKYGGSMKQYVRKFAEYEIRVRNAEKEENSEVNKAADSFLTDGWCDFEIEI